MGCCHRLREQDTGRRRGDVITGPIRVFIYTILHVNYIYFLLTPRLSGEEPDVEPHLQLAISAKTFDLIFPLSIVSRSLLLRERTSASETDFIAASMRFRFFHPGVLPKQQGHSSRCLILSLRRTPTSNSTFNSRSTLESLAGGGTT